MNILKESGVRSASVIVGVGILAAFTFAHAASRLAITTGSPPSGVVGTAYSTGIAASGGEGSYVWKVSAGALPAGLRLVGGVCAKKPCKAPAELLGTPTKAGEYAFTIQVSDGASSASKKFTVKIVVPSSQGTYFRYIFHVDGQKDEELIVKMTDSATIKKAIDDLNGKRRLIVGGIVRKGNGGFNAPWSWHLDPSTIALAEMYMEVCDGKPSAVEKDLSYWLGKRFCPWRVRVSAVYDSPPASASSNHATLSESPPGPIQDAFLSIENVRTTPRGKNSVQVSATISSVYGVKSASARLRESSRDVQAISLEKTPANSEEWVGQFFTDRVAAGVYEIVVNAQSRREGARAVFADPITIQIEGSPQSSAKRTAVKAPSSSVERHSATVLPEGLVLYENKNKQSVERWKVTPRCSCDKDIAKSDCAKQTMRRGADTLWRFIAGKSDTKKECYDRYKSKKSTQKSYVYTRLENPTITFDVNAQSYSDPDYNRVRLSWNVKHAATCSMSAEYKENEAYTPISEGVPWLGSTEPFPLSGAASVNMDPDTVPLEGSITLYPLSPMRYTLSCTSPDGLTSSAIKMAKITRLSRPVIDSASLGSHPYGYRPDKSLNWSSRSDLCKLQNPLPGQAETPLLAHSGRIKFTMPSYDFDAPSNDAHSGFDDTDYTLSCFGHEKDVSSPSNYIQASEKNDIRLYGPTAMSFKVYDETGMLLANATSSDVIAIARHKTNQPNSNNATVFFEWETRNADVCIASAKKYDPVSGEYSPVSNDIHWKSGVDKGVTSFLTETQQRSWQPISPPLTETIDFARKWQPVYRAELGDKVQYTLECKRTACKDASGQSISCQNELGESPSGTVDHRTIQVNFVE